MSIHIFNVDQLGSTAYFLSISYFFLALFATHKYKRINKYIVQWNAQKIFAIFILIDVYVRSIAFAVLCGVAITKQDVWYPLIVMLFTLPEYFMISTYIVLFCQWLEIYLFSHLQSMIISRRTFRKKWTWGFIVVNILIYIVLGALFVALMMESAGEDTITLAIEYFAGIGNLLLPLLMGIVTCYYSFFVLSGFPFASIASKNNVKKFKRVLFIWTMGRVWRGVDILLTSTNEYFLFLSNTYRDIILVSGIFLAEFVSIAVVLDRPFDGIKYSLNSPLIPSQLRNSSLEIGDSEKEIGTNSQRQARWEIPINVINFNQKIINDVGTCFTQKGSYNSTDVFIKGFRFQGVDNSRLIELMNNLAHSSMLRHTYIVNFLGVAKEGCCIYSITEYLNHGSLFDVIHNTKKKLIPDIIIRLAKQIAAAMQYLHSLNHIHGHLKSTNILLDNNMIPKVSDIGISSLKSYTELLSIKRTATAWSSPEVLKGEVAKKASDVYSYGIICWEMVTKKIPFEGKKLSTICNEVLKNEKTMVVPSAFGVDISHIFMQTIQNCLQLDLKHRPNFEQIIFCMDECRNDMSNNV